MPPEILRQLALERQRDLECRLAHQALLREARSRARADEERRWPGQLRRAVWAVLRGALGGPEPRRRPW
ncbi:MAG TPA: hypothetical protein VFD49_04435 [Candidatus Dormibacteraeota bacterium]|nr:hypothetical protein [Candidatus Dormibacteraeota bacterium]